jgi:hypothetical protein
MTAFVDVHARVTDTSHSDTTFGLSLPRTRGPKYVENDWVWRGNDSSESYF